MIRRVVRRLVDRSPQIETVSRETVSREERAMIDEARPYTMISEERLLACHDAVRYVVAREVPGAIVECGVWRGGAVLMMIRVLQSLGIDDRDVFLFDTFEGMSEPSSEDTSRYEEDALPVWRRAVAAKIRPWDYFFKDEFVEIENVRRIVLGTGYPAARIHFVQGRVEETVPDRAPGNIAVLRLDTDWYESTKHELLHLYPRLSDGGVLIVDDYGHWDGCRRAVDEYFATSAPPLLLARTDYTGRVGVKR